MTRFQKDEKVKKILMICDYLINKSIKSGYLLD